MRSVVRTCGLVTSAVIVLALVGCGPRSRTESNGDAGSNGNDNTADGGGSGDGGGEYDAAICQEDEFTIQALPPNLLIMLDRSGSMEADVPNSSGNRCFILLATICGLTHCR